jgi:hypothetical protein
MNGHDRGVAEALDISDDAFIATMVESRPMFDVLKSSARVGGGGGFRAAILSGRCAMLANLL